MTPLPIAGPQVTSAPSSTELNAAAGSLLSRFGPLHLAGSLRRNLGVSDPFSVHKLTDLPPPHEHAAHREHSISPTDPQHSVTHPSFYSYTAPSSHTFPAPLPHTLQRPPVTYGPFPLTYDQYPTKLPLPLAHAVAATVAGLKDDRGFVELKPLQNIPPTPPPQLREAVPTAPAPPLHTNPSQVGLSQPDSGVIGQDLASKSGQESQQPGASASELAAPLETKRKRGRPKKLLLDPATNTYIDLLHPNFKQLNKQLKPVQTKEYRLEDGRTQVAPTALRLFDDAAVRLLLKKKDRRGRPRKFPIEQTGVTIKGVRINGSKKRKSPAELAEHDLR